MVKISWTPHLSICFLMCSSLWIFHCFRFPPWFFWSDSHDIPRSSYRMVPPSSSGWFANPFTYLYVSPINHMYSSCLYQLSYTMLYLSIVTVVIACYTISTNHPITIPQTSQNHPINIPDFSPASVSTRQGQVPHRSQSSEGWPAVGGRLCAASQPLGRRSNPRKVVAKVREKKAMETKFSHRINDEFDWNWWFMMIYDDLWWFMMIYDDLWWFCVFFGTWWWFRLDFFWNRMMMISANKRTSGELWWDWWCCPGCEGAQAPRNWLSSTQP